MGNCYLFFAYEVNKSDILSTKANIKHQQFLLSLQTLPLSHSSMTWITKACLLPCFFVPRRDGMALYKLPCKWLYLCNHERVSFLSVIYLSYIFLKWKDYFILIFILFAYGEFYISCTTKGKNEVKYFTIKSVE